MISFREFGIDKYEIVSNSFTNNKKVDNLYNIENVAPEKIDSDHPDIQQLFFGLAVSYFGSFNRAYAFVYNKTS